MAGFVGGRIKRIKIQNFMTYDHVEIYPKKGLNLIVGLNGTGKSSIMCAICLGLAGKPQFTGRAAQLSSFIKHGCEVAEIEIELESRKKNVVIRRKLVGDKCEWYLDRSPSNQNEILKIVKKFNIDTSNLCQFLPQEKVVEFSRMDKKQRLENMLQAIGEPRLFQLYNELKDLRLKVSEVEQTIKKYEANKNSAEKENETISDDVQKQENRNRLKSELHELYKKRKICLYLEIFQEARELKEEVNRARNEVEKLLEIKNDAVKEEDMINNSYMAYSKTKNDLDSQKKHSIDTLTNKSSVLASFSEKVHCAKIEFKNKLKEKVELEKSLQEEKQKIVGLESLLENDRNIFRSAVQIQQRNSQALQQLHSEVLELRQVKDQLIAEKNSAEHFYTQARIELASLQDEQNKKMEILRRIDRDAHTATCWLLKNKTRFKSNIYLPTMLEIKVKSAEYAKYVENVIAIRDLTAFVCEDKNDCSILTNILKNELQLRVNIAMAPDTNTQYASSHLTHEQRRNGLECFVADLFTAPEPVMRYLCAVSNVHRIPVSRTNVDPKSIEHILSCFSVFFSADTKISGRRSRYGQKNFSTLKSFIRAKNLLGDNNDDKQGEIQKKLEELQMILNVKTEEFTNCDTSIEEKEKNMELLRQEKKAYLEQKKKIDNLEFTIIQKKKILAQKMTSLEFDEDEEKVKLCRRIQSINENRSRTLTDITLLFQDFTQVEKEIIKTILILNCLSKRFKLVRAGNEDVHDKVLVAQNELQNLEKKHQEKKNEGRILVQEIQLMDTQGIDTTLSMSEIERKINHVQAELNLNEDNEPLIAEYYERKQKIEKIQQDIFSCGIKVEELKEIIEVKKKEWLEPLEYHIANINKKFSYYFKQLNCAGEISLDIPENSDDFTKYGLQIKLKFHDDVPFIELSQTHHSGGECSVAAIVFILSLQELTEVPFRCIDEINQGMDSVNERKIYQLIADCVGQDKCSQYFLLTPKLLEGLEYPEDVAVHIIFNSCFLNVKLNVQKHLAVVNST